MKKLLGLLTLSFSLSISAAASADVAPDPCEGKAVGDVCETYDQKAGTCQQVSGFLDCVENSATTSSTTSGAGGGAAMHIAFAGKPSWRNSRTPGDSQP